MGGGPATIGGTGSSVIGTERLVALADRLCEVVAAGPAAAWNRTAGDLEWTVRRTVGHVVDALTWNSVQLASQAPGHVRVDALPPPDATPGEMLEAVRGAARLVRTVIDGGGLERRSWHLFGVTDPTGVLAIGITELLVHGEDITRGLGLAWSPDVDLVVAVQERLLPQVVPGRDPWTSLLAAHGRTVGDSTMVAAAWTWDLTPPG
ncbi:MAG: maleylpyruvate isomerase N-terminal domain-containing protein [Actinomycetales bacterium]